MYGIGFEMCSAEYKKLLNLKSDLPGELSEVWILLKRYFVILNNGISHKDFCEACCTKLAPYEAKYDFARNILTITQIVRMIYEMPEVYEYCLAKLAKSLCEFYKLEISYPSLLRKLNEVPIVLNDKDIADITYIFETMLGSNAFITAMLHLKSVVMEGIDENLPTLFKGICSPAHTLTSVPLYHEISHAKLEDKSASYDPTK